MLNLRTLLTAFLLAVCGVASAVTYVDRSGTITTGGTSQTLAAANPTRGRIAITNFQTETEVLCVNVTSAASCSTPGSWILAPGETVVLDSNELITVVAATTGHKFTAKENITDGFSINVSGSTSISGGAGDASAANQVTGNNTLSAINTATGATSDAAATQGSTGTISAKLRTVTSQLNTIGSAVALAQGSTTSGQTGNLTMGAVTTSAPSYTNAQTSPLSLDTTGALRVNVTAGGAGGGNVTGGTAHDAVGTSVNPVLVGGYSSAAAPTDVSGDGDAVRTWHLRNGAVAVQQTFGGVLASAGNGASGTGVLRVTLANDSTPIGALTETAPASDTASSGLNGRLQRIAQNLTTLNTSVNADPNYTGVIGAATAPTRMVTNGGVYNSTPPTLTNGQSAALQVSAAGRLNTDANVALINGVTPLMGAGNTGTGSQRVTIATDQAAHATHGHGATGAAVPANVTAMGARAGANSVNVAQGSATVAVSMSTATTTQHVALSGSTQIYVTGFTLISAGTTNVTLVYGTGSNCGTGTTSLSGAMPLIANAGLSIGGGLGAVLVVPAGQALCITNSAGVQISGFLTYTQF